MPSKPIKHYEVSPEMGAKIQAKIRWWEKKRAETPKPIRAWMIFNPDGKAVFRSLSSIRLFAKVRIVESPIDENWKHLYRQGYRVRRIEIRVMPVRKVKEEK